ncbi:MAG: hypothetical protein WCO44_01100 [Bacteroidota bacterium]
MKCELIQTAIADLFDDQVSPDEKMVLLDHITRCDDCRDVYDGYLILFRGMKTGSSSGTGSDKIDQILARAGNDERAGRLERNLSVRWQKVIRIAASIVIFLGIAAGIIYVTAFRNTATAAGTLLEKSIRAMISLKTVSMYFSIRTSPADNFESIDPASGFSDFKIWKRFGEPSRWRFEKPGRTIIMDGSSQYMINRAGGYILKGGPGAGFPGWMKLFLEPMSILEQELAFAKEHPSSCGVKASGNQLVLTIRVAATGNFTNPWALNSSVPESNSRRVYRFDKQTRMLASMEIFVENGKEDICVVKLIQTAINASLPDSLFTFANPSRLALMTPDQWDHSMVNGLKGISGEEAARIFFTACAKNDWQTVQRFSPLFSLEGSKTLKQLQSRFGGVTLIHTGAAFTSGMYAGIYIPYLLKLKSGDTLEGNLAIRNDNSFHTWNIDGGY